MSTSIDNFFICRNRQDSPSGITNKRKRRDSSDNDGEAVTGTITKALKIHESQGRPKAKDYDDLTQEVLATAISIYRSLVCSQKHGGFPDHTKELDFVKIAWRRACEELDVRLEMTPELVKMVSLLQRNSYKLILTQPL